MVRNVLRGGHKALRIAAAAIVAFGLVVVVPTSKLSAQETDSSETSAEVEKDATKKSEKEEKKKKKAGGAGIVPIPIFITEPAIGYGLGAAVGYFHPRKNEAEPESVSISPALTTGTPPDQATEDGRKRPPTITGVAAAYTEKGTWGVGVGHSASWRDDRIRYKGALAYANVESTFYFANTPFNFTLEGGMLYQDIKFRRCATRTSSSALSRPSSGGISSPGGRWLGLSGPAPPRATSSDTRTSAASSQAVSEDATYSGRKMTSGSASISPGDPRRPTCTSRWVTPGSGPPTQAQDSRLTCTFPVSETSWWRALKDPPTVSCELKP